MDKLTDKIQHQLELQILITEGITLTRYADCDEIPDYLRQEGIAHRERYCRRLFTTIREIKSVLDKEIK